MYSLNRFNTLRNSIHDGTPGVTYKQILIQFDSNEFYLRRFTKIAFGMWIKNNSRTYKMYINSKHYYNLIQFLIS